MSNSVRSHRRQPTRLPRPWDSPGKNTGVGCHFLLQCMKVKSESEVAQLCPTLTTPWTAAYQAPPSMGFSRQKYWNGVPLSSLMQRTDSFEKTLMLGKIESTSPKIRNKARVPTLTTTIQHSFGSFGHSNQSCYC